ncbi:MAG TPA: hypothetical protein VH393_04335 [Ktedonobacterales bacterium]
MRRFSSGCGASDSTTPKLAVEPFVTDDHIVNCVEALLRWWTDAVGNDPAMRGIARAIASVAGLHGLEPAIITSELIERPWRMLAAVARRAATTGNHVMVAQIFSFTSVWSAQIAPYLRPADWFDLRLDQIPPAYTVEIAAVTLSSFRQLPNEQVIFRSVTGSVTVGDLVTASLAALANVERERRASQWDAREGGAA